MNPAESPDKTTGAEASRSETRTDLRVPPSEGSSRRKFIHVCVGGMTAASAGIVTYPVVSFLKLPSTLSESQIVKVPLASLNEDQAIYKDHQGTALVVIHTGKVPKVFDAACTHLGCLVAWDDVRHVFRCPCHGAVFDDNGQPVSGPVSRPLKVIQTRIEGENLVIS